MARTRLSRRLEADMRGGRGMLPVDRLGIYWLLEVRHVLVCSCGSWHQVLRRRDAECEPPCLRASYGTPTAWIADTMMVLPRSATQAPGARSVRARGGYAGPACAIDPCCKFNFLR